MYWCSGEGDRAGFVGDEDAKSNKTQPLFEEFRDFPIGPGAKTPCSQCREPGSIPGQRARSHMPQLRVCMPQLTIEDPQALQRSSTAKLIN